MATEYKWVISTMDTGPSEDGLTDVVKTIQEQQAQIEELKALIAAK